MRRLFCVLLFFVLSTLSASAQTIQTITVKDPQGRPVAGARVSLISRDSTVLAIHVTNAEGIAAVEASGTTRVEVLAPGFAAFSSDVPLLNPNVQLRVAAVPQTVIVTPNDTPLSVEQGNASGSLLSEEQLELMQPVNAAEALRFLPGAVVNAAGRRGSLSSLFVRGGESRYNKVIVDGVPVNDTGGTFDFGVVPMQEVDRLEFVRGAGSTLYGSDAMTSTVQIFTRAGSTRIPELRFGADGGTFSTAHGYASLSGAYKRFDYNVFSDELHSQGQGVNDHYSNSSQGGNLGVAIAKGVAFRLRERHSNSRSGIQTFWNYNGLPLLPPDTDQYARQNNFLASGELTIQSPAKWQHRISGYEYNHKRLNRDVLADRGCAFPLFLDCDFNDLFVENKAGVAYRGEWSPATSFRTNFGYEFEVENGYVNQDFSGFTINSHGLRRNHGLYGEQFGAIGRVTFVGGLRWVHNETFGNRAVPRAAVTVQVLKGSEFFSGTKLRFAYGEGIKAPRLEESFGAVGAFGIVTLPNPSLKEERNRSFEAGIIQSFRKWASLSGTYFNNRFSDQVAFSFNSTTFTSQYVNLNEALAHGAEIELHLRPSANLSIAANYTHTSTQVLFSPLAFDPLLTAGRPLLRRPKHSGNLLASYVKSRWGASLGGSFVGPRVDSDFGYTTPAVTHAAGYARWDVGGWYAVSRYMTAYANVENLSNRKYEEVAGYPALKANFRAGMRFRFGGE
ncbi:MAG TPA: TonB-dependent receptor [Terriglobales bacterium]|nr:TonB-dependent receptor [Terriglobales bacterium]